MPSYTLIVIQKITTAIDNGLFFIDLDTFNMVRRVSVYHIHSGAVDQLMCEVFLVSGNIIAPVVTPMYRSDDDIIALLNLSHLIGNLLNGFICIVG